MPIFIFEVTDYSVCKKKQKGMVRLEALKFIIVFNFFGFFAISSGKGVERGCSGWRR